MWVLSNLNSPASFLLIQKHIQVISKKISKGCLNDPLWGESTGDWWCINEQLCRKHCHVMTSSVWHHLIHWGRDTMDAISQTIFSNAFFLNENASIAIKISLKFVPKGLINNITALVQIMAWRRPGDKPLSEPMKVSLPMHIYITQPQWVNHIFLFVFYMNCFNKYMTSFWKMNSSQLMPVKFHCKMVNFLM